MNVPPSKTTSNSPNTRNAPAPTPGAPNNSTPAYRPADLGAAANPRRGVETLEPAHTPRRPRPRAPAAHRAPRRRTPSPAAPGEHAQCSPIGTTLALLDDHRRRRGQHTRAVPPTTRQHRARTARRPLGLLTTNRAARQRQRRRHQPHRHQPADSDQPKRPHAPEHPSHHASTANEHRNPTLPHGTRHTGFAGSGPTGTPAQPTPHPTAWPFTNSTSSARPAVDPLDRTHFDERDDPASGEGEVDGSTGRDLDPAHVGSSLVGGHVDSLAGQVERHQGSGRPGADHDDRAALAERAHNCTSVVPVNATSTTRRRWAVRAGSSRRRGGRPVEWWALGLSLGASCRV